MDKVKRSVENRPQRTPDCKVGVRTGSEVSPAESAEPCGQLTSQKSSDSRSKPAPPCEVVAAELRLAEARRVAKEKLRKDKLKRRCELLEMEEQSNAEFADESTESEVSIAFITDFVDVNAFFFFFFYRFQMRNRLSIPHQKTKI